MNRPGDVASERKSLVLMFTDISNSTRLSAVMEIEDYADILLQFRTLLTSVMARHSGAIIRLDGDGALCAFGHPQPLDDAGRRAVEAAVDFHQLVEQQIRLADGTPLVIHTGIHAGMVGVTAGDSVRGAIEVLGQPTNVAARLCELARPNGIVVSDAVLGTDSDFFTVEPVGPLAIVADQDPLQLFKVAGRSAVMDKLTARRGTRFSPFQGRQIDIERVESWLLEPNPRMLLLWGEAGVGKSRFIAELVLRLRKSGFATAVGTCEGYPAARPLQPLRQIASAFAPDVSQGWADAELLVQLKAHVVRAWSQEHRLIIIDDWQWSDDTTVSFVDWLLSKSMPRMKLLVTSRNADVRVANADACALHPLRTLRGHDANALIGALRPNLDPLTVDKINSAAGGNPLMIEEICRDFVLGQRAGHADRISLRLTSLVERRLSALPEDVADAVQLCAVIGLNAPLFLLRAVLEWADDDDRWQALDQSGFVHLDGEAASVRFHHGLIRDAVYMHIAPRLRHTVHRRVADELLRHSDASQGDSELEALAYHLKASAHPLALDVVLQAGDRALSLGSLDRAVTQYRWAIELLLGAQQDVTAAQIRRVGSRYISAAMPDPHGDHLQPLTHLAGLAQRADWPGLKAQTRYWLASLNYTLGRPQAALTMMQPEDFGPAPDDDHGPAGIDTALLAALRGQVALLGNYHPRAAALLTSCMADLDADGRPNLRETSVYLLGLRGQIFGDQGNFAAADADFAAAVARVGPDPPAMFATVMSQRAAVELWAERHAACRATMEQSRDLGDRIGSRYVMMISRALLAYVDWLQHREPTALTAIERSIGWFAETGSHYSLALTLGWAADVAWHSGDSALADDFAHRSIGIGRTGLRWGSPLAWRIAALACHDTARSDALLRRAYASAVRMRSPREGAETLLCHAALLRRRGMEQEAHAHHMAANQLRAAMGLSPRD